MQSLHRPFNLSPESKNAGGGHPEPDPDTEVVAPHPNRPLPDYSPKCLGASRSPTLTPEGPLYISVPRRGPRVDHGAPKSQTKLKMMFEINE